MKIDIHVHTKKCKSGDAESRNINADKYDEIIRLTEVKISAITNHNHFDLKQYQEIKEKVNDVCQIWPGIELDIIEDGRRAHLIVIVNPNNASSFSDKVNQLLEGKTADNFSISIEDTVSSFDGFDTIYIAHYYSKKPDLLDEDLDKLIDLVSNKRRVLKEATNSISAGIYISHGHNSIYGSDIQNWDDYPKIAKQLPDLRLPVESFEQFCLLLEKDVATINTVLDRKTKESIQLNPFNAAELINIDIYNDINIFFGSKGTGKTDILKALSKYYNDLGFKNEVYISSNKKLSESYDIKGHSYDANILDFNIDDCTQEIKALRNSSEKNISSLSSYLRYFKQDKTNKISQSLKLKDFNEKDQSSAERAFDEVASSFEEIQEFINYIDSDDLLQEIVGKQLFSELKSVMERVLEKIKGESDKRLINFRSISLFNNIIQVFVAEIAKKTGQQQKPIKTGFGEYASNRIKLEKDLKKILDNINLQIEPEIEYVGDLGEKGKLYFQTNLFIQDGNLHNPDFRPVKKNSTKNPQKKLASAFKIIYKHLYENSLFEKIRELNEIEGAESITELSDLLVFNRHFIIDGVEYNPSTGESSMVLLHNELMEDKEIYIIDEPEKSLGNDYISNVIVPILKQKAQSGKKVIIATHDANIAVRTLPYNSIYRDHDINGYYTYLGNPFSNSLVCIGNVKSDLDWKEISMKTLEGGKEAFGERGKIYGNT